MKLFDLIPFEVRFGIAAAALLGALGGLTGVIWHFHDVWKAEGVAEIQPKLDAANAALGALRTANDQNLATIRDLTANQALSDLLTQQQADRVAALNQQAADAAAVIRRLQHDDQNVAAFLGTPIPDALRRVLPYAPAGHEPAASGGADPNRRRAAARAK